MPGVAYLLVKKNGQQVKSDNWGALEAPVAQLQVAALTKQKDDLSTEVANAKSLGFVWHPVSPPSAQSHPMSTPAPGSR